MHQKNILIAFCLCIVFIGMALSFVIREKTGRPAMPTPITDKAAPTENAEPASDQNVYITYLVSQEEKTKFCDGAVMDSDGYRKTITTEVVSDVSKSELTESELAKETAVLATSGMCQEALRQTDFTVTDGVVEIAPIEGWVGISIALCACKPQVEVNLLRIPGVRQVVWSSYPR